MFGIECQRLRHNAIGYPMMNKRILRGSLTVTLNRSMKHSTDGHGKTPSMFYPLSSEKKETSNIA